MADHILAVARPAAGIRTVAFHAARIVGQAPTTIVPSGLEQHEYTRISRHKLR